MNYVAAILTNKWFWIILVIIIILVIVIYKYNNRYVPAKDVQLPSDTQAGGITTWNPGQYTDALFEDLDEVVGIHESQPYSNILALSNSQVVAVYNDWNQRYKSKFDNKDLISAIEGEFSTWNYAWLATASTLVDRLKTLIPNRN